MHPSLSLSKGKIAAFIALTLFAGSIVAGSALNVGQALNSNRLDIVSIFLGKSAYSAPLKTRRGMKVDKVASEVRSALADAPKTSVVVLLTEQADLSLAYQITDQDERGWYVFNTLTRHATQTQLPITDLLRRRNTHFKSYWAANMIIADLDGETIDALAARPDVARIDPNRPQKWIEIPKETGSESRLSPTSIEWGVERVNAPAVWSMGHTGEGIVIGGLDTGIRWSHDALKTQYRGWNGTGADHNYNWHDAIHAGGAGCGANSTVPCDDSGHGTHTVGTMVGTDGAGNQIGVAPGARWIGCRNMNQGNGTPATYTECFQFMLAPTDLNGNNPDPTRRPHIVNNSWACPPQEGCTSGAELETIVNNVTASGIFVVTSAGNSGPGCSTVNWPPATYSSAFAVGSINISNQLAIGSSRGPSLYYSPELIKPNVSAPGVGVRSAYSASDTSFVTLNGTSMAGPHVAGAIALLWSANPELQRDVATTWDILEATANPDVTVVTPQTCGGTPSTQIPNNSFGYGRVDASLAVLFARSPTMDVAGRALTPSGAGLRNAIASVTDASGTSRSVMTNTLGFFDFQDLNTIGTYTLRIHSKRYRYEPLTLSAVPNGLTNLELVGLE